MSPEQIAALIEESYIAEPVYRSRVYGYYIERGETPIIISSEADVIQLVVERLVSGMSRATEILDQVAHELRAKNIRTRSKTLFTPHSLASLIRPYYSGQEFNSSGVLCPVSYYPPIITVQDFLRAKRKLQKQFSEA